jgi:hypothetical protein
MKKTKVIAGVMGMLITFAISGLPARAEAPPEDGANAPGTHAEATDASEGAGESSAVPNAQEGAENGSVASGDMFADIPEPELPDGEAVLNVAIPVTVNITIDPFEIDGRGQVYSEAYEIRNHGDTDVILTLSDFEVIFANNTDFEALTASFDETSGSDLKAIYMLLHLGRADIPPIVMTDANAGPISVPLAAAGEGVLDEGIALSLYFSGGVNHEPRVKWQSGDVKIRLTYRLEAVPVLEDEIIQEAEEETLPEEDILPEEDAPAASAEDETAAPEKDPMFPLPEEASPHPEADDGTTGSAVYLSREQRV